MTLISQRKVKELGLETFLDSDGMTFMTANGLTDSNEITIMNHEGLGQCKTTCVEPNTSSVVDWEQM